MFWARQRLLGRNSYPGRALQGSSAIQIVPALAKHAKQLDNYVRGSTWIATPFASEELVKRKPDAGNVAFTEEEKDRWANDPEEYMAFRKNMEREVRHSSLGAPFQQCLAPQLTRYFLSAQQCACGHPSGLRAPDRRHADVPRTECVYHVLGGFWPIPATSDPLADPFYNSKWRRSSQKSPTSPRRSSRALLSAVGG